MVLVALAEVEVLVVDVFDVVVLFEVLEDFVVLVETTLAVEETFDADVEVVLAVVEVEVFEEVVVEVFKVVVAEVFELVVEGFKVLVEVFDVDAVVVVVPPTTGQDDARTAVIHADLA